VSTIPRLVKRGRFLSNNDAQEVIIGSVLARNLKIDVNDELTLLGGGYDGSMAVAVLNVVGIFESGIAEIDRQMIEIPIVSFQQIFSMENGGHLVAIGASNLSMVDILKNTVVTQLPLKNAVVHDWQALQPGLMQAIQADMSSSAFMYFILIVLVTFSVLNTQLMSVLERTREFGTMMALGIKPLRLVRLIFIETSVMAGLGLAIGIFLGFLLTLYLSYAGFTYPGMEEMGQQFNLPSRIYPEISILSLMVGPAVVFVGCLFAAIYPASKLLILTPVTAMRAV